MAVPQEAPKVVNPIERPPGLMPADAVVLQKNKRLTAEEQQALIDRMVNSEAERLRMERGLNIV